MENMPTIQNIRTIKIEIIHPFFICHSFHRQIKNNAITGKKEITTAIITIHPVVVLLYTRLYSALFGSVIQPAPLGAFSPSLCRIIRLTERRAESRFLRLGMRKPNFMGWVVLVNEMVVFLLQRLPGSFTGDQQAVVIGLDRAGSDYDVSNTLTSKIVKLQTPVRM